MINAHRWDIRHIDANLFKAVTIGVLARHIDMQSNHAELSWKKYKARRRFITRVVKCDIN